MLFMGYVNNVLVVRIVASLGTTVIAGMQIVTNSTAGPVDDDLGAFDRRVDPSRAEPRQS